MQDDDPAEPTTGWSYCGQKTQFRQLPIGAVFATDRETESSMSLFRGQPGAQRYVKVGNRKYRLTDGQPGDYAVGTVLMAVWQPCAQPGRYSPREGLRVWRDEYARLSDELTLFREFGGTDINYSAFLRQYRDIAAARMASYARELLAELS